MTTRRSSWIGAEGRLFDRVSLVFEGLGYLPPTPDSITDGTGTASGAYVSNIEAQYYNSDFTADEIVQIIDYAKSHTLKSLQSNKKNDWIDREAVFGERS